MSGDGPGGRALLRGALRTAATVVLLLVAYYLAPLDRPLDAATGVIFAATLLLLGVFVAFAVRGIMASRRPRLRAVRALVTGLPLLLVSFAATYCTVDAQQAGSFTEPLSRTDGLYFTVTVFSTVGLGDIAPSSQLARILVTIQMVVGLIAVGGIAKVFLSAVRVADARRSGPSEAAELPLDGESRRR